MSRSQIPESVLARLREGATRAAEHNYARYSGILIVAAVETVSGEVFGGTNVEVANFTLTKHAEEMAIIRAIAAQSLRRPDPKADRWLKTLYVSGAAPCGSCRQFAWEWAAPRARCVIDSPADGRYTVVPLRKLFPDAFGPADVNVDLRPAKPAGGSLPA
jgi:cytidine deaminase